MAVNPDRLAGSLICIGVTVGLSASMASLAIVLGARSFALVLLLSAYSFRKRKESWLLAAAVVWFAALGAFESFLFFFFFFRGYNAFLLGGYYWFAAIPILGMAPAVAGGGITHLSHRPGRGPALQPLSASESRGRHNLLAEVHA